jgi:hypothetical protein
MPVTFEAAAYTAQNAGTLNGADRPNETAYGGNLRILSSLYTTTTGTDEVATDIINIGYLPKGAKVLPHLSYIVCEDPSSSADVALDVGTASDPNGFAEGVVIATAGVKPFITTTTLPAQVLVPVTTTAETLVYATFGGTPATMAPSKKVWFYIVYELFN